MRPHDAAFVAALIRAAFAAQPVPLDPPLHSHPGHEAPTWVEMVKRLG
jgi:hypothetical protein